VGSSQSSRVAGWQDGVYSEHRKEILVEKDELESAEVEL